jgi:hypothetical protein
MTTAALTAQSSKNETARRNNFTTNPRLRISSRESQVLTTLKIHYVTFGAAAQEQKRQQHTMQQTAATQQENEQDLIQIPIEYALHLQRHMHWLTQRQGALLSCCHPRSTSSEY